MHSGRIVWLASFPKSGNTWLRFLLATYLQAGPPHPIPTNRLSFGKLASLRPLFDQIAAVESSDLTNDEVAECRADVFRHLARSVADRIFVKVHDAWDLDAGGRPLFPEDATRCSIYVVRNPLDVAVSLANHMGIPVHEAAVHVCSDAFELRGGKNGINTQLRQHIGHWSSHAQGWIDNSLPRATVVRYEDLKCAPEQTFEAVLRTIGESIDRGRIRDTIQAVSFERLQRDEQALGFPERSECATMFFRGGRIGDGLRELAAEDIQRITEFHAPMMRRLGYLPPDLKR
jgi:aryl sulfotransferase